MNYSEAVRFLYEQLPNYQQVGASAYNNKLDKSLELDSHFGHPHRLFKTIHVAGTNGKGSVSHMLASILQECGYKTGLFTSPHLHDFRERVRVNGKMIPKGKVVSFVSSNRPVIKKINPSFFEMTAALAFLHFANEGCDVAVIETGLGGRLDSTNIINPDLSVITNIGMDHMALLGNTLTAIAGEKAGIIKKGVPVVIGRSQPGIVTVFNERAHELNSTLHEADKIMKALQAGVSNDAIITSLFDNGKLFASDVQLPLRGHYQLENLQTVAAAIKVLISIGYRITTKELKKGVEKVVKNTHFQGRWQVIGKKPLVICDTGHNEDGIARVVAQLNETPHDNLHMVIGMVADKEVQKIVSLMPKNARYYFTMANIPRSLPYQQLLLTASALGLKGQGYPTVKEALESAKRNASVNDIIFVGGSTFIVAEAF